MKKFYHIIAIKRDKEYYGTNFWNAGYKYSYTPTSYAMRYMLNVIEKYTEKALKTNQLNMSVVKSVDEEEIFIKITGRAKVIDKFITDLCTTDAEFTKRFSINVVPSSYVIEPILKII